MKCQLSQLHRPSSSVAFTPCLRGSCCRHRAALANGLVYSSKQGCLGCCKDAAHTVTRDPTTLPTKTGTARHFLLSFSFLFSKPHTTCLSSSPSGKTGYFIMAMVILSLILPDIDSIQTPVFQRNVSKTAL